MEKQSQKKSAETCIIIRYSEIALKKGNRSRFEKKLVENLTNHLKYHKIDFDNIYRVSGRIIIDTDDEKALEFSRLVFGVASASEALKVKPELDELKRRALELFKNEPTPESFRVSCTRLEKTSEFTSQEVERQVGQVIVDDTSCKVSLKNPEVDVGIETGKDEAYIYTKKIPGPGGLPVGVSGKVLVLFSGGIDSPVASWLCMRRGLKIVLIHFLHEDGKRVPEKFRKLIIDLRKHHYDIGLMCMPMKEIEKTLLMYIPAKYRIIVLRRIFQRISSKICWKKRLDGVATGDNIGQVASQTIQNIKTIDSATDNLWIRPLECFNKQDITDIARDIGTFENSIIEYNDCCNFLVPKHPATKSTVGEIEEVEKNLPENILEDVMEKIFWVDVK